LSGRLVRGENPVGYCPAPAGLLDAKASPLLHMQRMAPPSASRPCATSWAVSTSAARDRRAGGELLRRRKARLALALIAWERPNLLLLDEPTNHLDLEMRLALTMACRSSPAPWCGSHDRHLLKSTTDDFIWWPTARSTPSTATWTTTAVGWSSIASATRRSAIAPVNPDKTDKKAQRQAAAALRQQLAPAR
jgi:ATP-binding cassette subfamily F protein 3